MAALTRARVVAAARGWIGTRWQHQASLRGVACDCVGLVRGVMAELGLPVPAQVPYSRHPDGVLLMSLAEQWLVPCRLDTLAPGDVAVFAFGGLPSHAGIVGDYHAGGLSIIHAFAPARRVVETRLDDALVASLRGAFRLPEVEP